LNAWFGVSRPVNPGVRFLFNGGILMEDNRIVALQFLTNRYIDNVWKHIGIHLLAAGWVLSSAHLQVLLAKSIWVRLGLIFMFLIMQCVHSFINVPIYYHIKNLAAQIKSDVDENLSEFYGVSRSRFYLNEAMIASIAAFAIVFVLVSPYL
jgi:hypothetical protein